MYLYTFTNPDTAQCEHQVRSAEMGAGYLQHASEDAAVLGLVLTITEETQDISATSRCALSLA